MQTTEEIVRKAYKARHPQREQQALTFTDKEIAIFHAMGLIIDCLLQGMDERTKEALMQQNILAAASVIECNDNITPAN